MQIYVLMGLLNSTALQIHRVLWHKPVERVCIYELRVRF